MTIDTRLPTTKLERIRAVFWRHFRVYWNHVVSNSAGPFLEPLLFLAAVGVGLSAYVEEIQEVPYLRFLVPAQAMIAAVYAAIFETTYGTYFRLVVDRNYDAIVATPVSPREVFWGEIVYVAVKGMLYSAGVAVVAAALGLLPFSRAPFLPILGALTAVSFGALGLIATRFTRTLNHFSFVITAFFSPLILFSDTLFPVEKLPALLRSVAMGLPLYVPVHLARDLALERAVDHPLLSFLYLLFVPAGLAFLSVEMISKRLKL